MSDTPAAASPAPASTPAPAPAASAPSPAPATAGGAPSASGKPVAGGDASKTSTPAGEELLEITVDGKAEKWPIAKVRAELQIREAGRRRIEEAAKLKAELDAREKSLDDFDELTRRLQEKHGDKFRDWSQQRVIAEYEQKLETPEQKELRELRQQAAERAKADAQRAEQEAQTKAQEEQRQAAASYIAKWKGTLEKLGVPLGEQATPLTALMLSRFARLERQAALAGYEAPPEVLGDMVREELQSEQALLLRGLDGDALLDHLGPEIVEKVVRAGAPRLLAKYAPKGEAPVPTAKPAAKRDEDGRFASDKKSRADRMFDLVVGSG